MIARLFVLIRRLSNATLIAFLLLAGGCATCTHFHRLAGNAVGDEFRILCESYTYDELVGAHTGMIRDRQLWLYRIDLQDRHRFNGRSWTVRQLHPPGRIAGLLDEARLIGGSPLSIAEHYLWDAQEYELQDWDTDTSRPLGPLLRIPGSSSEFYNANEFFSPSALAVFTASSRHLVVQNKASTSARDMITGQRIQSDGLANMIDRCAAVSRTKREQVDPIFTEDLRFLLIVPPQLLDDRAHEKFSIGGVSYSFKDDGYYADRDSPSLRPFPMWHGGKYFGAAESDHGTLLLLYGDNTELLLRSADGTFEARARAPFAMLAKFESNEPGSILQMVFWNTPQGQVIIWDAGNRVFLWDYRTGRTRLLPDPTASKLDSLRATSGTAAT